MATNGLVLIKPSSVAKTGASSTATINAGGSVTFSLCETLSLNDVFSSAYDNYIIDIRHLCSAVSKSFRLRFRQSGTDNTTANSYVSERLFANGSSVTALRQSTNLGSFASTSSTIENGSSIFIYGPNLSQPSCWRGVDVVGISNAYIDDAAGTHNQSVSYDGLTLIPDAVSTVSGLVKVYGLVK